MTLTLFAAQSQPQTLEGPGATLLGAGIFFFLVAALVTSVSTWKIFDKAGRSGWIAIVPFYETWVRFQISGKPGWWFFPAALPIIGLVLSVIACIELAKRFGKSRNFGIMTGLMPYVGLPILAFGSARYSRYGKHADGSDRVFYKKQD